MLRQHVVAARSAEPEARSAKDLTLIAYPLAQPGGPSLFVAEHGFDRSSSTSAFIARLSRRMSASRLNPSEGGCVMGRRTVATPPSRSAISSIVVGQYPPVLLDELRGRGAAKVLFGTNYAMITAARARGLDDLGLAFVVQTKFLSEKAVRLQA